MLARAAIAKESPGKKAAHSSPSPKSADYSSVVDEMESDFLAPRRSWSFADIPLHAPDKRSRAGSESQPPPMRMPLLPIQAKLEVGAVDDPLEREADRVADQVMRMPEPAADQSWRPRMPPRSGVAGYPTASEHGALVRRKCSCGGSCDKCKSQESDDEHGKLQRKPDTPQISRAASSPAATGIEAPPIVHEVLRSPGQPLDAATRAFFEPRFGYDFSGVRIHADNGAAESAMHMKADAYTAGPDIVFAAGRFEPASSEGRRLLGHELTHFVQQQLSASPDDVSPYSSSGANRKRRRKTAAITEEDHGAVSAGKSCGRALQLKPSNDLNERPAPITLPAGNTDRIDDAYPKGSLNQSEWKSLLDNAKKQVGSATQNYLRLYLDVANLAQAAKVVRFSGTINPVTGNLQDCKDAKAGLNFFLGTGNEWDGNPTATGMTGFVDERGRFVPDLNGLDPWRVEIAIVLNRSAFTERKEDAFATLRHEMTHAEHNYAQLKGFPASAAYLSNRGAKSRNVTYKAANTELLAYVEGFISRFHLLDPPPKIDDPVFIDFLGLFRTNSNVRPWASADPAVRSEALGRIQEYYCDSLDTRHREALSFWVDHEVTAAGPIPPELRSPPETAIRLIDPDEQREVFFHSLQSIFKNACEGIATPMKLPPGASRAQSQPHQAKSSHAVSPLPGVIQRKPQVGEVDDPLEREADRVAEQVMRMPEPAAAISPAALYASAKGVAGYPTVPDHGALVQRKCSCGGSCDKCKAEESDEEHGKVQRKPDTPQISRVPSLSATTGM